MSIFFPAAQINSVVLSALGSLIVNRMKQKRRRPFCHPPKKRRRFFVNKYVCHFPLLVFPPFPLLPLAAVTQFPLPPLSPTSGIAPPPPPLHPSQHGRGRGERKHARTDWGFAGACHTRGGIRQIFFIGTSVTFSVLSLLYVRSAKL